MAIGSALTIIGLADSEKGSEVTLGIVGLESAIRVIDEAARRLQFELEPFGMTALAIIAAVLAPLARRRSVRAASLLVAGCRLCSLALVDIRGAITLALGACPVATALSLLH